MKYNTLLTNTLFAVILMSTIVFAQVGDLVIALGKICDLFAAVLPVIGFVLFVLAGVAYAAGNFFSAEIRAKATSWAMNMIVGAIVAFLLWIVGPTIIGAFSTIEYSVGAGGCSGGELPGSSVATPVDTLVDGE